jgi:hypothetical protein
MRESADMWLTCYWRVWWREADAVSGRPSSQTDTVIWREFPEADQPRKASSGAVVRKIPVTQKQPRASIHDAAHQGLMRLERHTSLRDDVAKTAPGWLS